MKMFLAVCLVCVMAVVFLVLMYLFVTAFFVC